MQDRETVAVHVVEVTAQSYQGDSSVGCSLQLVGVAWWVWFAAACGCDMVGVVHHSLWVWCRPILYPVYD